MQTLKSAGSIPDGAASHNLFDQEMERLEAVVETLAVAESHGEGLNALAHDARNMVTALGIYCELLEKPGVLYPKCRHYANELRLLSAASRRLVEKMVALDGDGRQIRRMGACQFFNSENLVFNGENLAAGVNTPGTGSEARRDALHSTAMRYTPSGPIANLAVELRANRNLLAALAGPRINLHLVTEGGELPVRLTGEDLTRILVNLVKNAAEAMPESGEIEIKLAEAPDASMAGGGAGSFEGGLCEARLLELTVSDNGPGIAEEMMDAVFEAGFTTRTETDPDSNWPGQHRGLGLSIIRSILESCGGSIVAQNLTGGGTRFILTVPVERSKWATGKIGATRVRRGAIAGCAMKF